MRLNGAPVLGRDKSDGLMPFSELGWRDKRLGEIEIASEQLDLDELMVIARQVAFINTTNNGPATVSK